MLEKYTLTCTLIYFYNAAFLFIIAVAVYTFMRTFVSCKLMCCSYTSSTSCVTKATSDATLATKLVFQKKKKKKTLKTLA